MSELDALIGDDPEIEEVTADEEVAEETEVEVTEEEPAENGSPTAGQDESEEVTTASGEPNWAKVAYLDEKRKRQDLERRLQELEQSKQPTKEQEKDLDLFADPQAVLSKLEARAEEKAFIQLTNFSRDLMKEAKPDYEEKEKVFVELAKSDSSLIEKMRKSTNPAKFAYETAVKHEFLQEVSDPVKYREKIKAELLAELSKETPKKKVPSLAKTTSVGGVSDPEDLSLESILGR
jgi:predicted protein tyrosine phosphatase